MNTQTAAHIPDYTGLGQGFLWVPHPHVVWAVKGSADNITGADLLGFSCEKVNAMDAWWPVRSSEGWQSLTRPKGLGIPAMRAFPNVWFLLAVNFRTAKTRPSIKKAHYPSPVAEFCLIYSTICSLITESPCPFCQIRFNQPSKAPASSQHMAV